MLSHAASSLFARILLLHLCVRQGVLLNVLLVTLLGIIHDAAKLLGKFRADVRQFGLWKSAQSQRKSGEKWGHCQRKLK